MWSASIKPGLVFTATALTILVFFEQAGSSLFPQTFYLGILGAFALPLVNGVRDGGPVAAVTLAFVVAAVTLGLLGYGIGYLVRERSSLSPNRA